MTIREQLHELKLIVSGDNNGRKGLVRRVDGIERDLGFIKRLLWVIFGLLLTNLGTVLLKDIIGR